MMTKDFGFLILLRFYLLRFLLKAADAIPLKKARKKQCFLKGNLLWDTSYFICIRMIFCKRQPKQPPRQKEFFREPAPSPLFVFPYPLFLLSDKNISPSGDWSLHPMKVFFFRCHTAPNMAFCLIDLQHPPHRLCQFRVDLLHPVCDVFMYGGFADAKFLCCLPHGGIGVDHKLSHCHRPFFNIAFQTKALP